MESAIRRIISECDRHPMSGATALRALFAHDKRRFFDGAIAVIRDGPDSHGVQLLLTLLLSEGMLTDALCDPQRFTLEEACEIARRAKRADPQLDLRMVRSQVKNNGKTSAAELQGIASSVSGIRMLDVLAAISDGTRVLPTMTQLLSHPDSYVRSKAALLVGRSNKNYKWVQERLEEPDARVRANAVESLWGSETEGSHAVFRAALADEDNRVVGNALLGLYRLGDPASVAAMIDLTAHDSADFRTTAVWVMGETGDPRFAPILARMMSDGPADLCGPALRAIAKLKKAMAKRAVSEQLSVFVGRSRRGNENTCVFTTALGCRNASVPDLHATNFALWEDAVLVKDYSVRHITKTEPIALALALPRIIDRRSAEQHVEESAVGQTLRHKRRHDTWMVLKYLSAGQDNPGVDAAALPPADDDLAAIRMRFTADPEAIEDAVLAPVSRLACASDLHQAARTLVRASGLMRGARNVILVCLSDADGFTNDVSQVSAAAEVMSAAVHVITCHPDEAMNRICLRTGGTLVHINSIDDLPEALERLYASLLNSYEVRYRPENPRASAIRLQVHTQSLVGECAVALG